MRRHRLTAVLLVLAAAGPNAAFGDPPASSPTTRVVVSGLTGVQLDPAIAVRPGNNLGTTRVLAVSDYATPTAPRISVLQTTNGTAWSAPTYFTAANVTAATLPVLAWGQGTRVYAAWYGRNTGVAAGLQDCDAATGIYLTTSTDSGASWAPGSLPQVKIRGGSTASPSKARNWPSLAVDASSSSTAGQPIVALERTTYSGASCTGTVDHEITLNWRTTDGASWFDYALSQLDPDPPIPAVPSQLPLEDASRPSIVSIPAADPTVAVSYLHQPVGVPATVEVVICSRVDPATSWTCGTPAVVSPAGFAPLSSVKINATTTVAASSAPSLAIASSDNALHVAFAGANGTDAEVYYAYSNLARTSWSTPVSVAAPSARGAAQFLPTLDIGPSGRADIVYLDRRGDGANVGYRAFATSFLGGRRGDDVDLSGSLGISPAPAVGTTATTGSRLAAATVSNLPNAYNGHGMGYWPQAVPLNTTPDVIEGDVWHGLSHPSLPAQAPDAPREVSKNAPTAIADLFAATDLDGDPVSVTVTAQPVHGVINGTTFTPAATFAGVDATTLQASDGYNLATSATYAIDVVNHAPLFDGVSPMVINEGSAVDVVVHAADQDASDVVHYALGSVPSALRNSVTLVGQSLHIAIPAGVRPAGTLSIDVLATDTTTPPLEVGSDTLSIGFTIKPLVRAPTVALTATTPSGHTVQLNAKAVWPDPGASCLGAGCHWSFVWDFGDGTTTSTTTSAVNHSYRRPGRYTPSVSATVVGYYVAVPAVSDRISNELVIADDARTLLFVRTRATKRTLTVTIQARRGAGLQVAVRVDGRTLTRKITVAGGTGESFGAARSVTFSLRGVRSRVAEVVVSFTGDLAGDPPPSPLRRLVWLR